MIVLADGGMVVIWVVGILVLGLFGFLAALLGALVRLAKFFLRPFWPEANASVDDRSASAAARVCPNPRCRHANPFAARYCVRCGQALARQS
mgnify:CR=1 FL=1